MQFDLGFTIKARLKLPIWTVQREKHQGEERESTEQKRKMEKARWQVAVEVVAASKAHISA
jgi:hypothetical protein